MRVVFDTNIYVSLLAFPGGQAEKALGKIISGNDVLSISNDIIGELLSVLSSKFGTDAETISHTALYLSDIAEIVRPKESIGVLKDEPDNRILECAVEAKADVIVTGDKEMLMLKKYQGIGIISLGEYLRL